jgi:hypothetical protein
MVDMRIALLGAMGFVGLVAARELSGRQEVRELLLVDYNIREAKKFAKSLAPKCRWAMADVGRARDLERLLDDVDAVASAVGPCREFEKTVLLTCAGSRRPAASIGDGVLSDADHREIHDAFRRAGVGAVSGCGLLPGWTDLLAVHFLPGGRTEERGTVPNRGERFLFCSPDRFGGYTFFRRVAREIGHPASAPPCAPAGRYFQAAKGTAFGIPEGRTARLFTGVAGSLGVFGTVGKEMSAAFLFWLRRFMQPPEGTPAAAAGVFPAEGGHGHFATISDPDGRASGTLLAETVLLLGGKQGKGKGLLPLPGIVGREEAERIASSCNATLERGSTDRP